MLLYLAPWGWKEIGIFGGLCVVLGVGVWFLHPAAAIVPGLLLLWTFSFFRDPHRTIPGGPGLLVSPADGTVTEITDVPAHDLVGEPSVRIGIFLSVFNVHVNRAPCEGRVQTLQYRPGRFLDARDPRSGQENESNSVLLERPDGRILVRQVSGAIARRIVCVLRENDRVERGQKIGMIKFGSRTELYVPRRILADVAVRVGEKVRGGETILARTR